ncbi:BREX-1 system adenine-specific DNA-methyltransferase PglX [Lacticaseibacillus zhaodongensis]|uniref:BREX-1 system adenine-specific DNA-methyltransferase PglX n=1 Tax=Lacticaseibacillus zhaodongensis TaxID=2668065 RepID=UPI0012D311FA|nr:BREX-1 system adenine-specific DNA-methyltransferase PglX [Lacticaseibacillus zhaodongensis]
MDKRVIEKFAVSARKQLIEDIGLRLAQLGIDENGASEREDRSTREAEFYANQEKPLTGVEIGWRQAVVNRLTKTAKNDQWATAYADLVEEVAYTWFNRIIAIRFMEVNDYLPSHVRVLSSIEGRNEPDIMTEALDISEYLGEFTAAEKQVYDEAWAAQDPAKMDKLYRMLFLKQIDALNENLPKLFEKTDDYMKLLFTPSYNNGVIKALVTDVPEADFDVEKEGQVEIIGWLYQYYNEEPKDAAFKKSKYTRAEIPAVTQLFTPDWIVKYLVENSLGRFWINRLQAKGDTRTAKEIAEVFNWRYFMPAAEQTSEIQLQIKNDDKELNKLELEDITLIDPSMGSGHILVYAFDVLMQLYESEGYGRSVAARSILKNNLFGLDIDTRAYQLTYFALMMKARQYDSRALTRKVSINVLDVPQLNWTTEDQELLVNNLATTADTRSNLATLTNMFSVGDELGSVISFPADFDWNGLRGLTVSIPDDGQLLLDSSRLTDLQLQLSNALSVGKILSSHYTVAVTNPPYMGSGKMPSALQKFVKKNFPNSKSDLFAVFMERLHQLAAQAGYYAMITQHQWMFLSSFGNLRSLLRGDTLVNLAHLGTHAFQEIGGEVVQSAAFVFKRTQVKDYLGTYERLVDFGSQQKKEEAFLNAVHNPQVKYLYRTNQANFSNIPGSPIAYWASDNLIHDFEIGIPLSELVDPRQGLATADNNRFLRQWFEVTYSEIKFDAKSISDSVKSKKKWFPYNKGGAYRKWYGNYDYVINWENDGYEIRNFNWPNGKQRSVVRNPDYYFREAITWSKVTSGSFNIRYRNSGSIFDTGGNEAFADNLGQLLIALGVTNSKAGNYILEILNPTINMLTEDFKHFPVVNGDREDTIKRIVAENINYAESDWNIDETSWDFLTNPLLHKFDEHNRNWTIAEAFDQWKQEAENRFEQLKSNEEELNRIFIDLYGLQDELAPEEDDKDVSVRRADYKRDIKAFLSYFVGVTFGRYSLDTPGLAFAGGEWDAGKYKSYVPNTDDVLLLTDADYFGDNRDVIYRLKEFLTVTFGQQHLSENLDFIAGALDKKGDSSEAQIRKYFVDDFYKKDHLSTYQKRPIYWQLQSGKKNGFKALMYLHRYDSNTMAAIRTKYLHPLQSAYENRIEQLKQMLDQGLSGRDKNVASKELDKLLAQLDELVKYDQVLQHVANQHIVLDLDDGVLVNHKKVQAGEKLLTPIK